MPFVIVTALFKELNDIDHSLLTIPRLSRGLEP